MSLPLKLFPVLLLACSASAGSQGTFAGRLVDAETGKPISSARGLRKANGRNEKHSRHSRASRGRQGEVSLPMSAAPDAQCTRPTRSRPSRAHRSRRSTVPKGNSAIKMSHPLRLALEHLLGGASAGRRCGAPRAFSHVLSIWAMVARNASKPTGFAYIAIGAKPLALVRLIVRGTEEHDRERPRPLIGTQALQHFQAVEPWHVKVEQKQNEAGCCEHLR